MCVCVCERESVCTQCETNALEKENNLLRNEVKRLKQELVAMEIRNGGMTHYYIT